MARAGTVMAALGFSRSVDALYQRLLAQSGRELVWVAEALVRTPEQLLVDIAPLVAQDVVRVEEGRVFVAHPGEALVRMLSATAATAAAAQTRLSGIADAIPLLTAASARPGPGEVSDVVPIDGEISSGGHVVTLLEALITRGSGDLLWLRPDQWREPREDAMSEILARVIATGRRSRAVYPVRALHEAGDTLRARVAIGEEVRLLPEVPTRMLVLGSSHAILPEPLGFTDEPRTLIRQHGLVEALTLWFEALWDRAAPVPGLGGDEARPDLRRFLLQELAAGAQDEQIARRLGISLRTVRRRVADILSELGADTRFQAGVEAVRRGWL